MCKLFLLRNNVNNLLFLLYVTAISGLSLYDFKSAAYAIPPPGRSQANLYYQKSYCNYLWERKRKGPIERCSQR
jgi:hypothetical protein